MANPDYQIEIPIVGPFMDSSAPPSRCPQGIFSRLTGVDGRFRGTLRRFPGFKHIQTLAGDGSIARDDIGFDATYKLITTTAGDFEDGDFGIGDYITVSGADEDDNNATWTVAGVQNGYLSAADIAFVNADKQITTAAGDFFAAGIRPHDYIRVSGTSGDNDGEVFYVQTMPNVTTLNVSVAPTEGAAGAAVLNSRNLELGAAPTDEVIGAGGTVTISSSYNWGLVHYTDGDDNYLTFQKHCITSAYGNNYVFHGGRPYLMNSLNTMGPERLTGEMAAPASASQATSGYLHADGIYRVAYMYYDSDRHRRTGLSTALELTGTDIYGTDDQGENHNIVITVDARPSNDYDYLEIYRSPNLDNPLDAYQGAVFYRESVIAYNGTKTVGALHDTALVLQKRYDPWADPVMDPPKADAGKFYQGSIFAGRYFTDNEGVGLYWTNPYDDSVECFGSEYSYDGSEGDGSVHSFVETEDGLYACAEGAAYYILKTGGSVAIKRILAGRSSVSRHGAVAAGKNVYIMSSGGLMLFSGGQPQYIHAVNRIIIDEWMAGGGGAGNTMEDVWLTYDSVFNCVFVLNTTLKSMICLWEGTQAVTLLEGCPFVAATSGLAVNDDTASPGAIRAYFVTATGRVVRPDESRHSYASMTGQNYTNANSKYTVPEDGDAKGATWAGLIGGGICVYCTSGNHEGIWGYSDGLTINYIPPWGSASTNITLQEGDIWVKDPIAFRARFAPYQGNRPSLFSRKVIKDIGLKVEKISVYSTGSIDFKVGVFRDAPAGPTEYPSASGTITATGNPADDHVTVKQDGISLQPYVEQVSTGCDFELTAIQITGTLSMSDNVEAG